MSFFVHYFHVSPNIQKYNGSFEQYFDISLNIQNKAYVSIRRFFCTQRQYDENQALTIIMFCLYIIKFAGGGGVGGVLSRIILQLHVQSTACACCILYFYTVFFCIFKNTSFIRKIQSILPVLKLELPVPRDHTCFLTIPTD